MAINPDDIERLIKGMALPPVLIEVLTKEISINFDLGIQNIEKLIDRNILAVNPEVIDFIKQYNFDLIKGMNTDLANSLRDTLKRNILNGDNPKQMVKDIKDIFNTTKNRAEAIARTESVRAYSQGQQAAAEQAGIELVKYWSPVGDNRTSELCMRLGRKYNRENAIPIDKHFKDKSTGGEWNTSPSHVNCRCSIVYVPKPKD